MTILAIETSCDETGIALVKKGHEFEILSNIVASQVKIHEKYGGVYPSLAKREHQKNLVPVLGKALTEANLLHKSQTLKTRFQTLEKILKREKVLYKQLKNFFTKYQRPNLDALAVTVGPGLEPCLWVGVNFARGLGFFWNLPIIPVNHLEGHIAANFIGKSFNKNIFPAVCLIISGGHTQLVLMENFGRYQILGETRDDAAGECFDKTARLLGLGYPGGPEIERVAKKWKGEVSITLPRPMINQKNYDFSFSGLKTAVLYKLREKKPKIRKAKRFVRAMAAEIQQAICDVLIEKTIRAAKNFKAKTIILGGGVAANKELRKQLKQKIEQELPQTRYLKPNISFCTDNAAMIGVAAFFHLSQKKTWKDIKASANLRF